METVVLVIHLLIAMALVGVILMQRSEGGGLGIGGGGMGGMLTARGTANLLTRTTAILAASFMATSIVLALMAGTRTAPKSLIETIPAEAPVVPAAPAAPAAPVAQ
jgi:preprotein translocase subunit SecG